MKTILWWINYSVVKWLYFVLFALKYLIVSNQSLIELSFYLWMWNIFPHENCMCSWYVRSNFIIYHDLLQNNIGYIKMFCLSFPEPTTLDHLEKKKKIQTETLCFDIWLPPSRLDAKPSCVENYASFAFGLVLILLKEFQAPTRPFWTLFEHLTSGRVRSPPHIWTHAPTPPPGFKGEDAPHDSLPPATQSTEVDKAWRLVPDAAHAARLRPQLASLQLAGYDLAFCLQLSSQSFEL